MGLENNEISKKNLYDRVKKLLVSFEWSDCSFTVSGKNFKAHKLILGISSPVFEAMFYGPLSSDCSVNITDIHPDIFQMLLNYIYTDTVEILSIEQAFELLYASRKYLLEHLSDMCITYIQENINVDNVIEVLNYPEYLQDKQIISYSLKLFCEHAQYLLQEKKHLISHACMKMILDCDTINIMERNLVKHVFEWTVHYSKSNDIPCTVDNRRKILIESGLFNMLRCFTLSLDDIEEIIADENNLLLSTESDYIKSVIINSQDIAYNNDKTNLLNSTQIPRKSLKIQWHYCHRSSLRSVAPIIIDANNYVVQSRIKSNKSIFIISLYVPTRMAPAVTFRNNNPKVYSEQLSISIISESDNSIIKFTNFMNTVKYNSVIDIELGEPCLIKKDRWYKISFVWPQNGSVSYSYVVEVRDTMYKGQTLTLDFVDSSSAAGFCGSFLGGLKYCL